MAFVPGKTSDLFISYAWKDNAPERAIGQEWVSTFHDTLKSRLSKAPLHENLQPGQPRGEDPVIWFDQRLPSDARITPTIEEAVKGSACLVVVLSPSYNNSPWCHRERELFLEANPDGPIFIVEHLPLMDPKDEQ